MIVRFTKCLDFPRYIFLTPPVFLERKNLSKMFLLKFESEQHWAIVALHPVHDLNESSCHLVFTYANYLIALTDFYVFLISCFIAQSHFV